MATNLTKTTFLTQYNDDYRDSDHYHRILFNNGRALQARELTQSQTIIQKEVERLAKFVLTEGAIINNAGTLASGSDAFSYTYIKVTSLPTGHATLVGSTINDGDLYATVKATIPDASQDVIMVRMGAGKAGGSTPATDTSAPKKFAAGSVLSSSLGNITIENISDAVGSGSIVECPAFSTYAAGHLINVEAQTLVLDKFSSTPTKTVGFKVTQQIITAADNVALYDNSGATPNLTSPGADRLKITLTLTTKDTITSGETFYSMYEVKNGRVLNTAKTTSRILGNLSTILNARTEAITGNFIEKSANGEYDLFIRDDSASSDFLSVEVSSGTAFIKGNKITRENPMPFRVRKPNDINADENITVKSNEFVSAAYGTYFLSNKDSAFGMASLISDYSTVNLKAGRDLGGTTLGTARIRMLDAYGADLRTHVFDVQMDSNGSGTVYNLANVRSVGTDASNFINLKSVLSRFDLYDKQGSSLLFPLPRYGVNEISTVSGTVGKVVTHSNAASTIAATAGSTFDDFEQWLYVMDSGDIYSNLTITGTDPVTVTHGYKNGEATLSPMPSGTHNAHVLTFESRTFELKTKTLTPDPTSGTWHTDSSLSLSSNKFTVSKNDVYQFHKVIDDATNEDITYKFIFNNGQTDNYYGPGTATLKQGASAPSGTVNVQYRYFLHSTPSPSTNTGYFGPNSYVNITYDKIPEYLSPAGAAYRLADCIDMRPAKNPADGTFSGGTSRIELIPRNKDNMTAGTVKYWNPRLDCITMSQEGLLIYNYGTAAENPAMPANLDPNDLLLHQIKLSPYTMNSKDLSISSPDYRGYKMEDIRRIDKRLDHLERMYTLTAAELNLAKLEVYDPDNANTIRQTEGLTGDGFEDKMQSDWFNDEYRAKVYQGMFVNAVTPKVYNRAIGITYDSAASAGTCVIKGSTVWPKFTEAVADFSQENATAIENVNQFETPQHIAAAELIPEGDYFTKRRKVDQHYSSQSNESLIVPGTNEVVTND